MPPVKHDKTTTLVIQAIQPRLESFTVAYLKFPFLDQSAKSP